MAFFLGWPWQGTGFSVSQKKSKPLSRRKRLSRGLLRCRARRDHHLPKTGEQKLAGGYLMCQKAGV
jgi:hypothetical protein